MSILNCQSLWKQLICLGTVATTGVVIGFPSLAGAGNPSTPPLKSGIETPASVAPASQAQTTTPDTQTVGTIVEVAANNPSFRTLVAAVKAAGLEETLSGQGPFTVFAPTDAAFEALPKGTLETLLKPENKDKLTQILTYHVVPGEIDSASIKPGKIETVEGQPVTIKVRDGKVKVNNAAVTTADVKASNGVIHVIDKVILPPGT